jgi:hypothetical protein
MARRSATGSTFVLARMSAMILGGDHEGSDFEDAAISQVGRRTDRGRFRGAVELDRDRVADGRRLFERDIVVRGLNSSWFVANTRSTESPLKNQRPFDSRPAAEGPLFWVFFEAAPASNRTPSPPFMT